MAETKRPTSLGQQRAKDIRDFWWHLAVYVLVNAGIFIQDIVGGTGVDWAYWVAIPWGVGLLIHAVALLFEMRRPHKPSATF